MEIMIATGKLDTKILISLLIKDPLLKYELDQMFYVIFVDGEIEDIWWDGKSYEDAILVAEEIAHENSWPIVDIVVQ